MRLAWHRPERRLGLAEAYVGLGVLVVVGAILLPHLSPTGGLVPCPLYTLTDIPCLTCGFTRAFVRMAHLEVGAAFSVSPLGATTFLAIAVATAYGLVRWAFDLPWPRPLLDRREARLVRVGVIAAILANWVYLVVRHKVLGDWG